VARPQPNQYAIDKRRPQPDQVCDRLTVFETGSQVVAGMDKRLPQVAHLVAGPAERLIQRHDRRVGCVAEIDR